MEGLKKSTAVAAKKLSQSIQEACSNCNENVHNTTTEKNASRKWTENNLKNYPYIICNYKIKGTQYFYTMSLAY